MDELIKMVVQKAGISDAAAKTAVTTVIDYLKQKLPGPVGSQIDAVLKGGGGLGDAAKGLAGKLGIK